MNKTWLFLPLLLLVNALCAQVGLFDLAYDDPLNTADSLLFKQGFVAAEVEGSMVKYYTDYNPMVDSVVLFVNPETEIVAGWFVKYNRENTPQQDEYLLERLHTMHGREVQIAGAESQLIWGLDKTRSVHAQYTAEGNFCVLYYDSAQDYLFALPPSVRVEQGAQGQEQR